ncbi:hypothetical protein [Eisenibacter elegans]|jgi:hypothetical protein|uniref:hypothetical protein n=1 Tax=Eisenibacter elegans TaxID=997 RepID=UPI00040C020B|nr:hypothetical protein [Eisenibacter elegans]
MRWILIIVACLLSGLALHAQQNAPPTAQETDLNLRYEDPVPSNFWASPNALTWIKVVDAEGKIQRIYQTLTNQLPVTNLQYMLPEGCIFWTAYEQTLYFICQSELSSVESELSSISRSIAALLFKD